MFSHVLDRAPSSSPRYNITSYSYGLLMCLAQGYNLCLKGCFRAFMFYLYFFYLTVCTQLLTSTYDDEGLNMYLQLIDKCINHEVGQH